MIKILGISGSPRMESTAYAVQEALRAAEATGGVETQFISLKGKTIQPCIHCNKCVREGKLTCTLWADDATEQLPLVHEADGIIFGSPVYGMGITPQLCAFMSRFRGTYGVLKDNPHYFARQVGGAIAVGGTRNGGQECVNNIIYGFFSTHGITPANGSLCVYSGACVWSRDQGAQGAQEDETGMANCRRIGEKVAKLAKALKDNKEI
ncbi:MAG: flavodoxin family protein [Christensenellaceae bacterium]|jgi:multimeric flavodoxin WrbA|nr:flavodoxin family protein [Christensenellaceae bacterium]